MMEAPVAVSTNRFSHPRSEHSIAGYFPFTPRGSTVSGRQRISTIAFGCLGLNSLKMRPYCRLRSSSVGNAALGSQRGGSLFNGVVHSTHVHSASAVAAEVSR